MVVEVVDRLGTEERREESEKMKTSTHMPSILTSTLDTLDPSSAAAAAARNSSSSSRRAASAPSRSRSFPLGLFAPIEEVEVEGAKRAERGVEGREDSNEEKPMLLEGKVAGEEKRREEEVEGKKEKRREMSKREERGGSRRWWLKEG